MALRRRGRRGRGRRGRRGRRLGPILGHLGAILGLSWSHLGPSWGHLGAILGIFRPSCAILTRNCRDKKNLQKPKENQGFRRVQGLQRGPK